MKQEKIINLVPILLAISIITYLIIASAPVTTAVSTTQLENRIVEKYKIEELVSEIEQYHCNIPDSKLIELKLTQANIVKKHEFCNLSKQEKTSVLANEFDALEQANRKNGVISGFSNSYSCYYSGLNTGIPTYQDLGLSSTSCTWTDPNPSCKNQGGVACMWGCTNKDPVLGWKTKSFTSKSALESVIKPKGYLQANTGYYSGLSYTRQLPHGYRYEVQGPNSGSGSFASEGPEPDPGFNWYAFTNGWYPFEAGIWHLSC